jgi:hypothetical protein
MFNLDRFMGRERQLEARRITSALDEPFEWVSEVVIQ